MAGPLTELTVALSFGLEHLRSVEEAVLQPEPMMSWVLRLDCREHLGGVGSGNSEPCTLTGVSPFLRLC